MEWFYDANYISTQNQIILFHTRQLRLAKLIRLKLILSERKSKEKVYLVIHHSTRQAKTGTKMGKKWAEIGHIWIWKMESNAVIMIKVFFINEINRSPSGLCQPRVHCFLPCCTPFPAVTDKWTWWTAGWTPGPTDRLTDQHTPLYNHGFRLKSLQK